MRTMFLLLLTVGSCGCSSIALRSYTTNQSLSVADMRYQEVLHNLALIAHNQGNLPSFAVVSTGAANVSNTLSGDANTVINESVNGFSSEAFNAFGNHNPELQWTIAPVVGEPNLEALKYACLWVLCGRPDQGSPAMELLRAPSREDVYGCPTGDEPPRPAGFHFDVAQRLDNLRGKWLGVGTRWQVPHCACYTAHCCDTYVWVMPDGLPALSEFTLIIMDIATIDPKSLVLRRPMAGVQITQQPSGDKVTEQWYACQEANASGTIRISRPKSLRQLALQMPDVVVGDFVVLPAGPTPREAISPLSPR
jgi:hypothetical protein